MKKLFLLLSILFTFSFAFAQDGIVCPQIVGPLQRGSNGPEVKELQAFLKDYYDLGENDFSVSGYFGRLTQKYLVKFQLERGLQGLGIAGPLTRAQIAIACGNSTPAPVSGFGTGINYASERTYSFGGAADNILNADFNFDGLMDHATLMLPGNSYAPGSKPTINILVQTTSGNYIPSTELNNIVNSVNGFYLDTANKKIITTQTDGTKNEYIVIPGYGLQKVSSVPAPVQQIPQATISLYLNRDSNLTLGESIPLSYNVQNNYIPNTQVILSVEGISTSGGNGGGTWQSEQLVGTFSEKTYSWPTGGGFTNALGSYKVTAYLVACDPAGCSFNYDSKGGLGRKIYATSLPIYFNLSDKNTNSNIIINYFKSDKDYTNAPGLPATLSWSSFGATKCYLTGGIYGGLISTSAKNDFNPTDNVVVYPTSNTQYSLSCQNGSLYANKFLNIQVNTNVSSSATVDQTNITAYNNNFTITGSAMNVPAIFVALVRSDYSGPTDWTTIYNTRSYVASNGDLITNVTNNRWVANFTGISSGNYKVLVYGNLNNAPANPQPLLGSGYLYVNNNSYINATFNVGSTQTLGVGQTISDGWMTLTLVSVRYSNGNSGTLQVTFNVSTSSGYSHTYTGTLQEIVADAGEPGYDYNIGHAARLTGASVNMQTATIQFNRSQKG